MLNATLLAPRPEVNADVESRQESRAGDRGAAAGPVGRRPAWATRRVRLRHDGAEGRVGV